MVLCGGYARGHAHRGRPREQQSDAELMLQLIKVGWGTSNPKFRRVFATMFLPDGTPAQNEAFDELQRVSATPEVAYRLRRMFDGIDVTALCGQVRTPTLVMHVREDAVVPFEEGRLLAALIPGSRFVPLAGRSHVMVPGVPAWEQFFAELRGSGPVD
jgi:pimeloyl-ACP methyl ester carboxylesterase